MSRTKRAVPHWADLKYSWKGDRCPILYGRDRKPISYVLERPDGRGWKEVVGPTIKKYYKKSMHRYNRRKAKKVIAFELHMHEQE